MEKVLGELMGRDNGLLRGKGGSMHLTSVEHGVMGSYAIVGAHICRSPAAPHGARSFKGKRTSRSASSATAPRTSGRFTKLSISPRSGNCLSFSSVRTISIWNTRRSAM
jgi:hypothetical protein